MDNDPPGSWNGVVQTPLRKLWVQCQRVATSLSKVHGLVSGSGYAVATLAVQSSHCLRRLSRAPTLRPDSMPLRSDRHCATRWGDDPTAGVSRADSSGACLRVASGWGEGRGDLRGTLAGSEIGSILGPSRTPQKGGPGTPQKGGCRDTKQCKFWRVSSVLIQGLFCFWGVLGGFWGVPAGGPFWGVRTGFRGPGRPGDPTVLPPNLTLGDDPAARPNTQDEDRPGVRRCRHLEGRRMWGTPDASRMRV